MQSEALLTATREPAGLCDLALTAMLGLLGLRIFEAASATTAGVSLACLRCGAHEVHVDNLKPKADDPLDKPGEGSLVGQLGAQGGGVRACGDLAVVELCAQRSARLAAEGELIREWSHRDYASHLVVVNAGRQCAWRQDPCRHLVPGDSGVRRDGRGRAARARQLLLAGPSAGPDGDAVNAAVLSIACSLVKLLTPLGTSFSAAP